MSPARMSGNGKIWLLIVLAFSSGFVLSGQSRTMYTIEATVSIRDGTREELLAWVEESGGYFVRSATDSLDLRIPLNQVQGFKSVLQSHSRSVLSYKLGSSSIDQEYQAVKAAVTSREEILKASLEYIPAANVKGTIALEKEIASIIEEIETYKGRLRLLENRSTFAVATVFLQAPPPRQLTSVSSAFFWLREIDFYSFMGKTFE